VKLPVRKFVVSLYPHMLTNFGKFILIFLRVLVVFTVSSFQFQQVRLPWLKR